MLRIALRNTLFLILVLWGGALHAQHVESPLVPRGQLYFRIDPSTVLITGLYNDSGGDFPLGAHFFVPELQSDQLPGLTSLGERIAELTESSASPFRIGGTTGRFSANEQVLPLRLDFGIFDRLSLGVTLPLVRKRVSTLLRYTPAGAEIGTNPRQLDPAIVDEFITGAESALSLLRTSVEESCTGSGESSQACLEGRGLVEDSEGFLLGLDGAYTEENFFPLENSGSGTQIANRWSNLRTAMGGWDITPPEDLPLSSTPLSDADFRTLLEEVWDAEGFPFETPDAFLKMGDVELHLALGLLNLRPDPPTPGTLESTGEGLRLKSAVEGTFRFPTGEADSLRYFVPTPSPRGAGGVEVRWLTDLLLPGGIGLLGVVEAGFNQAREMTILAPDLTSPFTPGRTRAEVEWTPGNHLQISVSPRKYLGNTLSIGAGWHFAQRESDTFIPLETLDYAITTSTGASSTHSVAIEFRYAAMEALPDGSGARRPFEILIRGVRSLTGSGPWALKETRLDAGGRILLRR